MSKKMYILELGIIALLTAAFILSFSLGMDRFSDANSVKNEKNQISNNIDKFTSSNVNEEYTISPNSQIILKIEYSKSGDIESKALENSKFIGKSKSDLEKAGYLVESITKSTVNLYRKVDKYAPNKYILGLKDDCFAIYKTDENGDMIIENEGSDVTEIRVPTKSDYNLLIKGSKHFQFDNKEDAEAKLGEYDS